MRGRMKRDRKIQKKKKRPQALSLGEFMGSRASALEELERSATIVRFGLMTYNQAMNPADVGPFSREYRSLVTGSELLEATPIISEIAELLRSSVVDELSKPHARLASALALDGVFAPEFLEAAFAQPLIRPGASPDSLLIAVDMADMTVPLLSPSFFARLSRIAQHPSTPLHVKHFILHNLEHRLLREPKRTCDPDPSGSYILDRLPWQLLPHPALGVEGLNLCRPRPPPLSRPPPRVIVVIGDPARTGYLVGELTRVGGKGSVREVVGWSKQNEPAADRRNRLAGAIFAESKRDGLFFVCGIENAGDAKFVLCLCRALGIALEMAIVAPPKCSRHLPAGWLDQGSMTKILEVFAGTGKLCTFKDSLEGRRPASTEVPLIPIDSLTDVLTDLLGDACSLFLVPRNAFLPSQMDLILGESDSSRVIAAALLIAGLLPDGLADVLSLPGTRVIARSQVSLLAVPGRFAVRHVPGGPRFLLFCDMQGSSFAIDPTGLVYHVRLGCDIEPGTVFDVVLAQNPAADRSFVVLDILALRGKPTWHLHLSERSKLLHTCLAGIRFAELSVSPAQVSLDVAEKIIAGFARAASGAPSGSKIVFTPAESHYRFGCDELVHEWAPPALSQSFSHRLPEYDDHAVPRWWTVAGGIVIEVRGGYGRPVIPVGPRLDLTEPKTHNFLLQDEILDAVAAARSSPERPAFKSPPLTFTVGRHTDESVESLLRQLRTRLGFGKTKYQLVEQSDPSAVQSIEKIDGPPAFLFSDKGEPRVIVTRKTANSEQVSRLATTFARRNINAKALRPGWSYAVHVVGFGTESVIELPFEGLVLFLALDEIGAEQSYECTLEVARKLGIPTCSRMTVTADSLFEFCSSCRLYLPSVSSGWIARPSSSSFITLMKPAWLSCRWEARNVHPTGVLRRAITKDPIFGNRLGRKLRKKFDLICSAILNRRSQLILGLAVPRHVFASDSREIKFCSHLQGHIIKHSEKLIPELDRLKEETIVRPLNFVDVLVLKFMLDHDVPMLESTTGVREEAPIGDPVPRRDVPSNEKYTVVHCLLPYLDDDSLLRSRTVCTWWRDLVDTTMLHRLVEIFANHTLNFRSRSDFL